MDYTAYAPLFSPPAYAFEDDRGLEKVQIPVDKALRARNLCVLALVATGLTGVGMTAYGGVILAKYYPNIFIQSNSSVPHEVAQGIKLLVNFLITLLIEGTSYIHGTTLRWSLQREGKLEFNSNLRLLSSSATSPPNKWFANLLYLLCTVFCYAGLALIFWARWDLDDPDRLYMAVSGCSATALGVSLIGMCALSTWALCTTDIPTWSSSPLHTALVAIQDGSLSRRSGRCMRGAQDIGKPSAAVPPRKMQATPYKVRRAVRWLIKPLVFLVGCCIAAAVVSVIFVIRKKDITYGLTWDQIVWNNKYAWFNIRIPGNTIAAPAIILILLYGAVQCPVTLGLHVAELIINLSRDEAFWRTASSKKGLSLKKYDSIWAACTSWRTLGLFFFKAVIHWTFGTSAGPVYTHYDPPQHATLVLQWRPIQSIYFAIAVLMCVCFTMFISLRRPKGPQPAAYGHLQTLVDLIDEWSPTIYWGHKSDHWPCHAGTSSDPLPQVNMNVIYAGSEMKDAD